LAPKKATAKTSTGMAINNPIIGIMVKLTTVRRDSLKITAYAIHDGTPYFLD
jgi:hypothetical protein